MNFPNDKDASGMTNNLHALMSFLGHDQEYARGISRLQLPDQTESKNIGSRCRHNKHLAANECWSKLQHDKQSATLPMLAGR